MGPTPMPSVGAGRTEFQKDPMTASRSSGSAARGLQIIPEIDDRKEVITMAKKKGGCGCGCIEMKPAGEKPDRGRKEDRQTR